MKCLLLLALLLPFAASAQTVPQAGWKLISVDSANAGYPGTNAFDGNPSTFWHTDWQTTNPPLPHEIQIDLGAVYNLTGFTYLSRQDGSVNGDILQYNFYVTTDLGQAWTNVSSGTGACSSAAMTKTFTSTPARYIRLQAITSCFGNWMNVAELNVTGTPATPPPVLDMITVSLQVKVCASACDGTDDTPETGTLIVDQQKLNQTFAFNSDGTISAHFGIDTSVDPADFTFSLTDATGSLEYKIPQAVLAGQATIGTLALPPMRIQKTANGIVFKGFITP